MSDNTVNFFFIGSTGVGKSAIIQQILKGTFVAEHNPTPYTSPVLQKIISGHHVSFWDTRGSDTLKCLEVSIPSGRCALVFVYDVTDGASLHEVKERISEFQACGFTNPIVLLGNKIDEKSQSNSNEQNLKKDYPQAFVLEMSAKSRTEAKALFVGLLGNEAFIRQLDAHSPKLDGAQTPRINATLKQQTRTGCAGFLWQWLSQHLFRKDTSSADHIKSPFSVEGTVLHHIAQPSEFTTVTPEHETESHPPSPGSLVLLPETPAGKPASVKRDQIFRNALTSSPVARTTSDILAKGKFMPSGSKLMIQTASLHISQFLCAETVFVWIHQPLELIRLTKVFEHNFDESQHWQPGICAIEEFWYMITDRRVTLNSLASPLLFETAKAVFASSLRQRCENAEYMASVQTELSSKNPSEWARRHVWSLFVYARNGSVAYRDNGTLRFGLLIDVVPCLEGVRLCLGLGGIPVDVVVLWTNCGDINSRGIYLDPAMQRVVSNLAGWSVTTTDMTVQDYGHE